MVEVNIQGVVGLLGGDVHDVAVDVGAAEFGHVGVAEGGEGAEAEEIPCALQPAGFFDDLGVFVAVEVFELDFLAVLGDFEVVDGEEFFPGEEDDWLFYELELGLVGLDGGFLGVAFTDGPVHEPEEVFVLLLDGVFLETAGVTEVDDEVIDAVPVEVVEVFCFLKFDDVVLEDADHADGGFLPGVCDGALLDEFFDVLLQGFLFARGGVYGGFQGCVFAGAAAFAFLDLFFGLDLGDVFGVSLVDGELELDAKVFFRGFVVEVKIVVREVGLEVDDAAVDAAGFDAFGVGVAGLDVVSGLVPLVRQDGVADGLLEAGAFDGDGGADGLFSGLVDVVGEVELYLHGGSRCGIILRGCGTN